MAFKILSEEQIGRLTPRQQESYRAAYEEYREREAFVQKIEKQRNIKVPEFKIKKRPIKRIRRPSSSPLKFDGYGVQLGEASDKLFNTTKHASEQAERLGKRKKTARADVHVPGVRVAKGRRIKTAVPKRRVPKLSRVPVVKPSDKQFEFRPAQVSVGNVFCQKAPSVRRNKPTVNITPLTGVVLSKARGGKIQAPKRMQPILPKVTYRSAAAVRCHMEAPNAQAAPAIQIKQPQIATIAVPKHTVVSTEKTVATAPIIDVKRERPVAPAVKGTVPLVPARNIAVNTGNIRVSPIHKQQVISAPAIAAKREKQVRRVKALPSVAVAAAARKVFKAKPPVVSPLPKVHVSRPQAVAADGNPSEVFHADGKAQTVSWYPNRATFAVPVINQTAEVEKILGTLGR